MCRKLLSIASLTAAILLSTFVTPVAADNVKKGLEIATELKQRDIGWVDTEAETQMILRNAAGQKSVRELRIRTLENRKDGDKSLTIFDQPRDVAGTAFLSLSKIDGADDQWIYLPAVKRVKRIATRNKSGPFMGSEFAFEDMTSFEVAKYTYLYLRDEKINGLDAYVVEQTPVDKFSGYSKQIVWIDKAEYRVQKIEFYDKKGALLKILQPKDYEQHEGKYWRANESRMDNVQTRKSTTLLTKKIDFKTGVKDRDFNKNALKRIR